MTEPQERSLFAIRLAQLREASQLSQKELAARAGCWPTQISRYEKGRGLPRSPEMYLKLSAALSVSAAELLGAPPDHEGPADPRLALRVRALNERLAPAQVSALLAFLDALLALADGDLAPAADPGGAA
jgi:transcriptional regulator with XRE-family HTH domain